MQSNVSERAVLLPTHVTTTLTRKYYIMQCPVLPNVKALKMITEDGSMGAKTHVLA
jgi:hypothetical protein